MLRWVVREESISEFRTAGAIMVSVGNIRCVPFVNSSIALNDLEVDLGSLPEPHAHTSAGNICDIVFCTVIAVLTSPS
jgi:hypothetical protein